MIEVKTQKRYKCDFCKRRSVKSVIARHETTCYRNPNRICYLCENSKVVDAGADYPIDVPCPECERFDKNKLTEIEAREKGNDIIYVPRGENEEIPF